MRYTIAVIIILLFMMGSLTYAQTDSVQAKIPLAMQLSKAKSFDFYFINGTGFSYKTHLGFASALRYNLDFYINLDNGNTNNDSRDQSYSYGLQNYSSSTSSKSNNQRLEFSAQYLIFPITFQSVRIFIGSGPLVNWERRYFWSENTSSEGITNPQKYSSSEETTYYYGLGIGVIGGIECFFSDNISFSALHDGFIRYNWYEEQRTFKSESNSYEGTRNSKGHFWTTSLSSIRLGISFYF
ncbi:MAG: hypothetical protein HY089_12410 [Ignavibacteriales bacterium]|nr:hypothetical protein [Ignavibacteriales bacterium]